MPEIKLADGTPIFDVREWDGQQWISRIVRVRTVNGWEDAYRPIYFNDNAITVTNAVRRSTTALVDDGFKFDTKITFTISS